MHHHSHPHEHYSIRVHVFLNTGDHSISDFFRLSYSTEWDDFFSRVKMALCPELIPEPTDCMRDRSGAHVFDVDVLANGEVLYFCPRGGKLVEQRQNHQQGPIQPLMAPAPTQNFIQAASAFATGMQHPDMRSSGFGHPGLDFQQALSGIPPQSMPISFPDPDGGQPAVQQEQPLSMYDSGAIYFPSPVPPDEEPPYVPDEHRDVPESPKPEREVGNAAANVGGNTGCAEATEQKPEGELEEKAEAVPDAKAKEKEAETEKQEVKSN